jgi:hypothetical protein
MTASNRFEDRLLDQLREVVAARPAPAVAARRRPVRGRLVAAGAGVAATTAIVVLVATSGDVAPAAYAVESRPDGSVTVEIRSLRDAAGLQRSLRAAGVPAVVSYAPADQDDCVTAPGEHLDTGETDAGPSLSHPGPGPGATTAKTTVGSDGTAFTIDPGALGPGEEVYITTSTGEMSTIAMAIGKEQPAMPCAP